MVLAVAVVIFAGFFASSLPDGLEKVAENLGFGQKAGLTPGAFVDYTISSISHPTFSTVIAGLIGVIIIFFIFRSISKARHIGELLKKLLNLR